MNGNGNPTEHAESPDAGGAINPELEAVRREADEHRDRHLRAVAELDNFRKRSAKEIEAARKFGAERLAQAILPVRDSLVLWPLVLVILALSLYPQLALKRGERAVERSLAKVQVVERLSAEQPAQERRVVIAGRADDAGDEVRVFGGRCARLFRRRIEFGVHRRAASLHFWKWVRAFPKRRVAAHVNPRAELLCAFASCPYLLPIPLWGITCAACATAPV